jgi:4-hydroxy-3-polyprenylbenzoate decarboxylase
MVKPWVVGITGASGAIYGVRLIQVLLEQGKDVHLVISESGWRVLKLEHKWDTSNRADTLEKHFGHYSGKYHYHHAQDIGASIASGSFRTSGMVICPCSMGTLAAVSNGNSDNLLERAADVMLKEGRKLIIVPRETPLHQIHLENMLRLAKMGVNIIPAMPAFYQGPTSVEDMIDFVVGKVLDTMDIDHRLFHRWGEQNEQHGKNSTGRN